MADFCSFGFHKWSQWESYRWSGSSTILWGPAAGKTINTSDTRQRRTCERCGKMQVETVSEG